MNHDNTFWTASAERLALLSDEIVGQIRPLLAGYPATLQGMVIADLTAIWLHGHRSEGGMDDRDAMREAVLEAHANAVKRLLEYYDSRN